jgi:hypothetical protein
MSEFEDFTASLALLGEAEVRKKLAQSVWANKRKSWAEHWLQSKEAEQVAHNQAATLLQGTEDSAIAKKANEIAQDNLAATRSAKNAAWVAAVAAIIAAVFAALAYVFAKT